MQEWLNWHAWKACVPATVPWVRIPLFPQYISIVIKIKQQYLYHLFNFSVLILYGRFKSSFATESRRN